MINQNPTRDPIWYGLWRTIPAPDQVTAMGPPFDPVAPLIGAGEKM
jgi:hypothetical protein